MVTKVGAADPGLKIAGGLVFALFFLVVAVGGGVYRTECIADTGQISKTWSPEGDIPYPWSPDDSHCQALIKQVGGGSVAVASFLPCTLLGRQAAHLARVGGLSEDVGCAGRHGVAGGRVITLTAAAVLSAPPPTLCRHVVLL